MNNDDGWYYDILGELDTMNDSVTDWEANFIEDVLEQQPRKLTTKQRDVIEHMKGKYLA